MQMIWEVPLIGQARREKISERMKILQDLVPGCNKVQYGFFYVFMAFFCLWVFQTGYVMNLAYLFKSVTQSWRKITFSDLPN